MVSTGFPHCGKCGLPYIVQNDKVLSPASIVVADGIEDAVTDNGWEQLLDEQSQQDGADSGEDEVVDEEQCLQLEGRAVAHHLAAAKDDAVVDDNEDGS